MSVGVQYGPVGLWFAATATLVAGLIALLVALGLFERLRGPRLHLTFAPAEPWCRAVEVAPREDVFWVRVGVENKGRSTARGCIGRLTAATTDDVFRSDVDPIQLSWAGVPRSRAFAPVDLRPGQREFLNVLYAAREPCWTIDTFQDDDFRPGFSTHLSIDDRHAITVAVFADNASTVSRDIGVDGPPPEELMRHPRPPS